MNGNWFSQLKQWLGIKDSIYIYDRPERGCYSSKFIKSGEPIVKIKSKYLLEYLAINNIYRIHDLTHVNSLVAYHLMILEKNQDMNWLPYLKSLPRDTSEFELDSYSMSKLTLGHIYNDYITDLETDAIILYDNYCTHRYISEPDSTITDYDEFFQQYSRYRYLVGSRIFGYERNGISQSGLIPYVDLFNHSRQPNSVWTFEDTLDSFVLYAIHDIKAGDEIYDHYGNQPNFNLLVYYGFIDENNPHISISFRLSEESDSVITITESTDLSEILNMDCFHQIYGLAKKYLKSHQQMISQLAHDRNIQRLYLDELKLLEIICNLKKL